MPAHPIPGYVKEVARRYRRDRDWQPLFGCALPDDPARRIALVRLAKNGELERGRAGHWSYSMSRLISLKGAYIAERLDWLRYRHREALSRQGRAA